MMIDNATLVGFGAMVGIAVLMVLFILAALFVWRQFAAALLRWFDRR